MRILPSLPSLVEPVLAFRRRGETSPACVVVERGADELAPHLLLDLCGLRHDNTVKPFSNKGFRVCTTLGVCLKATVPERDVHVPAERIVVCAWAIERHLERAKVIPQNAELLLAVRVVRSYDPELCTDAALLEFLPTHVRLKGFRCEVVTSHEALPETTSRSSDLKAGGRSQDLLLPTVRLKPNTVEHRAELHTATRRRHREISRARR